MWSVMYHWKPSIMRGRLSPLDTLHIEDIWIYT